MDGHSLPGQIRYRAQVAAMDTPGGRLTLGAGSLGFGDRSNDRDPRRCHQDGIYPEFAGRDQ
jgi:hypothetical protein